MDTHVVCILPLPSNAYSKLRASVSALCLACKDTQYYSAFLAPELNLNSPMMEGSSLSIYLK